MDPKQKQPQGDEADGRPQSPTRQQQQQHLPQSQQLQHGSSVAEISRSCVSCYQRKIRCDRKLPCCSRCARTGTQCSYPSFRREPVRRSQPLHDISDRLQRLEFILLSLVERPPGPPEASSASSPSSGKKQQLQQQNQRQRQLHHEHNALPLRGESMPPASHRTASWETLLRDGEKVHYVDNGNLLDLFQDEERMHASDYPPSEARSAPPTTAAPKTGPPLPDLSLRTGIGISPASFGAYPGGDDVLELFPEPQLALRLWRAYVDNVDPVLKILHVPTMQTSMISLIADPAAQPKSSFTALAFAVYFAAATSLTDADVACLSSGTSRMELVERFKTGLNQTIIDMNLFTEPDLATIQAVVIFATCLRVHDPGRGVWILIGTAIRLAQSIGIHRNGAALKLSPFESELRLRLWWHLNLLDERAPEDHGFAYTIDHAKTTLQLRLPLNVNDDCLFPAMQSLPAESTGWTEGSFALMQMSCAEVLRTVLGIDGETTREGDGEGDAMARIHEAQRLIEHQDAAIMGRFFPGDTSTTGPWVQRTAAVHYRVAYVKMHFMLQIREHLVAAAQTGSHPGCSTANPKGPCEMAVRTACLAIRHGLALLTGEASGRFSWLFHSYTQWYALAYVLRYIGAATEPSAEAEEGWRLVNRTFDALPYSRSMAEASTARGSIWRCLARIRQQVARTRECARPSEPAPAATEDVGIKQAEDETPALGSGGDVQGTIQQPPVMLPSQRHGDQGLQEAYWDTNNAGSGQGLPDLDIADIDIDIDMDAFRGSMVPDMLYLSEWNDIVNGGSLPNQY